MQGIDENSPYSVQPPTTTPDALNVRSFDALERRKRGGQRTGIAKYLPDQVNGNNPVQGMAVLTEAFDPAAVIPDAVLAEEDFSTYPTGRLTTVEPTKWIDTQGATGADTTGLTPNTQSDYPQVEDKSSPAERVLTGLNAATNQENYAAIYQALSLGDTYVVETQCRLQWTTVANRDQAIIVWRSDPGTGSSAYSELRATLDTTGTAGDFELVVRRAEGGVGAPQIGPTVGFSLARDGSTNFTVPFRFEVRVNGDTVQVYIGGELKGTFDTSAFAGTATRVGLGFNEDANEADNARYLTFKVSTATQPASLYTKRLVAASGGSIAVGSPADGLSIVTGGSGAVATSGAVRMQAAFQDVFIVDGNSANYIYYDAATTQIKDWATDVTAGALPTGSVDTSLGCSIIALYRGRIVMSGLEEDPQNWFMSKAGDPFNWDYSPATTTQTQAVAGNNSDAGLIGDVVTALIPFRDDYLVVGGASTVDVIAGDPAAGGRIDNITRGTGIVGPEAWTIDEANNIWFFGQNGLYRLSPGQFNVELVSRGKLDKTFASVDYEANRIRLFYDPIWHGIHIFIAPLNEPESPTDQYFYDLRNQAFWRDQYPTNVGPSAAVFFDSPDDEERRVIIGGYDGYIRSFEDDATNDDGQTISSHVVMGPMTAQVEGRIKLSRITATFDRNGNDVTIEAYRGDTAEQAANDAAAGTSPFFSVNVQPGRAKPLIQTVSGANLALRVENADADERWAMERMSAVIQSPAGLQTENQG